MKFNELLGKATNEIPFYRQPIFQIIIIGLVAGVQPGRISSIFRCFSNFIPSHFTLKRFYNFINSGKIPWHKLWDALLLELGDPSVDGRILLALDDELSPKTGKKIQSLSTNKLILIAPCAILSSRKNNGGKHGNDKAENMGNNG